MPSKEIDELLDGMMPRDGGTRTDEEGESAEETSTETETEETQDESASEENSEETEEGETQEPIEEVEAPVEKPLGEIQEPSAEIPAEEPDKLTQLEAQNKALLEQINALAQAIETGKTPQAPKEETPAVEAPKAEAPAAKKNFSLFDGVEFEDVISNPATFEKTMARMAKFIQDATYTNILRTLPVTVTQLVQQTSSATEMVNNFYKENDDLAQVKPFVKKVLDGLTTEHPEWEIAKLFDETAKAARKALGLARVAKPGSPPPAAKPGAKKLPAFAKGSKSHQRGGSSESRSGLQKQIQDLLD